MKWKVYTGKKHRKTKEKKLNRETVDSDVFPG
jgi:hypothetical protein